jgi:hypothetical protein
MVPRRKGKPPWLGPVVGSPIVIAGCVFALSMLPREALAVLTAWTLGSVPIGVLFGHCVLSEE